MNPPGDAPSNVPRDVLVEARRALLDACDALRAHLDAVVLVGAQAIYLHTHSRTHDAGVVLAEFTRDSDLALDTRHLSGEPLLEQAMTAAGFYLSPTHPQPGSWFSPRGIEVDLMVPEALAGTPSRRSRGRGVDIPPHDRKAARRTVGLEAAVVDHSPQTVSALQDGDPRSYTLNVAGPAALLVAKLHKVAERQGDTRRSNDKDAHDLYRLLVAVSTADLADGIRRLSGDPLSAQVTAAALEHLDALFAASPQAAGSMMAGRAEDGVGDPDTVAASVSVLAAELLQALGDQGTL